jgi:hypothetical protein
MRIGFILAGLTSILFLTSCAALDAERVQEKEARLAASQFVRNQADTPAKLAKAQAMPQRHMFIATRGSKNYYIYADVAGCQCVYVGNEAAYQQYQQLTISQNIAREEVMAAELNQQATFDFESAWGPGFYY